MDTKQFPTNLWLSFGGGGGGRGGGCRGKLSGTVFNHFNPSNSLLVLIQISLLFMDVRRLKVTMHLQIDNFLQIWIFESKYWSKCDLKFKKKLLKKTKFWRRNRSLTFRPEVNVYPLIDSPMMLCNQPRRLSRD